MSFGIIQENITLKDRDALISAHVYMQFKKHDIHFSENDINVIVTLYNMNGYRNKEEQDEFFNICISKKYKSTKQSLRNTLNEYTKAGFLSKPKNLQRFVNNDFIPDSKGSKVGAIYKVSYASN